MTRQSRKTPICLDPLPQLTRTDLSQSAEIDNNGSVVRTIVVNDAVCSIGQTRHIQRGTAYFLEPSDTISGVNWFNESTGSEENGPFFL